MSLLDDHLAGSLPAWLSATGPDSDLVLSSRIRLARNLAGHKFVRAAANEDRMEVFRIAADPVRISLDPKNGRLVAVDPLDDLHRQFLVERRLISPDMQRQEGKRGVVVDAEQLASVMINEEDHLRLQCIQSGFSPASAWAVLDRIDTELSNKLEFAFSERWGFLTACPTNTGTGLRVSVLIHLPALVLTKNIEKVIQGINQLGLTVRGFYGEGSEVLGNLFQISNQTTLGKSEKEILETLEKVIQQIIGHERTAWATLLEEARPQIEDKVWRAYGILRNARLMNSNEFMSISSAVRLGIALGIIKDLPVRTLNELMARLQPAHLQIHHGKEMEPTQRDLLRAQIVRERLSGN